MNTFENSANRNDLAANEQALLADVKQFFKTDSCAQIIGSMNALVEGFLFSEDLENVTPEMRVDIVNQLRVVTLISRLNENNAFRYAS